MVISRVKFTVLLLGIIVSSGAYAAAMTAEPTITSIYRYTASDKSDEASYERRLLALAEDIAKTIASENKENNQSMPEKIVFEVYSTARPIVGLKPSGNPPACIYFDSHNIAHIYLNADILKDHCDEAAIKTIMHELAHAYDAHLKKNWYYIAKHSQNFDYYPHLHDELKRIERECPSKRTQMLSHEWHAEWQAIQWLKQHASPKVLDKVRKCYAAEKNNEARKALKDIDYSYPPSDVLVKWLA